MDKEKLLKKLTELAQLDVDAILAYNKAIEAIDEEDIRMRLGEFRADHDRHINDLTIAIRELGGDPPTMERDIKGFFIEGMTAIQSKLGTRGALTAMFSNETLTNVKYKNALKDCKKSRYRSLIERNYKDEQRHIAYIKETLKAKFGFSKDDEKDSERATSFEGAEPSGTPSM